LDHDDVLSLHEVTVFFRKVTEDISMERITDVSPKMDQNGDDTLDFNEFKVCIIYHILTK
jgi:Ca2+-binding EF-hand superfamily protein